MMKLKGRRILVTGGAVRIGAAVVRRLAAEGARVVIHARSSVVEAEALRDALLLEGHEVGVLVSPLDSDEFCRHLMNEAVSVFGGLDGLVNNAATFAKTPPERVDRMAWLEQLTPNLFAPFALMVEFRAHIASRADAQAAQTGRGAIGRVVNIVDRRIVSIESDCIPYLLSKKMLWEATRILARAYAPAVAVNAVAPGAVLPPPRAASGCLIEKGGHVPLDVQCRPDDVAEAVAFLLGADTVTGQTLFVDGGQHLLGSEAQAPRGPVSV